MGYLMGVNWAEKPFLKGKSFEQIQRYISPGIFLDLQSFKYGVQCPSRLCKQGIIPSLKKSKRLSLDGLNPARFRRRKTVSCVPPARKYPAFFGTRCAISKRGEYDSKDEKLQDTVGIKPQKLTNQRDTVLGVAKTANSKVGTALDKILLRVWY